MFWYTVKIEIVLQNWRSSTRSAGYMPSESLGHPRQYPWPGIKPVLQLQLYHNYRHKKQGAKVGWTSSFSFTSMNPCIGNYRNVPRIYIDSTPTFTFDDCIYKAIVNYNLLDFCFGDDSSVGWSTVKTNIYACIVCIPALLVWTHIMYVHICIRIHVYACICVCMYVYSIKLTLKLYGDVDSDVIITNRIVSSTCINSIIISSNNHR